MELKVRKVGNALGVILPKQLLAEAGIGEGGKFSVEKVGQVYRLTPMDEEFTRQVEAFLQEEPKHKNTYRELAK